MSIQILLNKLLGWKRKKKSLDQSPMSKYAWMRLKLELSK